MGQETWTISVDIFLNLTFMNPCIVIQLCRLIYYSKSALHVSDDVFAHHQEHLTVFTVSGSVHSSCCRLVSWMSWNCSLLFLVSSTCFGWCFCPSSGALDCIYSIWWFSPKLLLATSRQQLPWTLSDTVNTVKCSWWWAKTSSETCRAD
jgi:hypothetical protein